jgi:transposase InsO family protein
MVGWEIHTEQTSDHAAALFGQAHLREGVAANTPVLHADHGSPMKGAIWLVTLQRLSVVSSFSQSTVSHDNPYSEALFKTCQSPPSFPEQPFVSREHARIGVAGFVYGYNDERWHSRIRFVTPGERHRGDDTVTLEQR